MDWLAIDSILQFNLPSDLTGWVRLANLTPFLEVSCGMNLIFTVWTYLHVRNEERFTSEIENFKSTCKELFSPRNSKEPVIVSEALKRQYDQALTKFNKDKVAVQRISKKISLYGRIFSGLLFVLSFGLLYASAVYPGLVFSFYTSLVIALGLTTPSIIIMLVLLIIWQIKISGINKKRSHIQEAITDGMPDDKDLKK